MKESEAQTWLNTLERRADGLSDAQKKPTEPTPRLVGGLHGEYQNVGATIARLRDLCMALEQGRIPEVIFQSVDRD